MACWLCTPLQNKTNTKWERSLFVSNPVLVLITKQDTIFCHRTQEKAILKSVLEFRWLNERCLSCIRWLGASTEVAGAAHCEEPPVTVLVQARGPCLTAVRSRCYQKECSSWLYRLYISHFSSLQKTPSAAVTMCRGTALWTTVNPESSICYWQKTLRCSRCRLLLGLLRSYRYDPAVVALTVASWEWNAAHITFHLTLISQMFIILPSAFLPCLLLWISSLSCY